MNKLSHYKDNLFASHATMESALEYVSMMANTFTTENSLAVITAARVVLNTAIELHKAELAKANAPLLELIEAEIQKSFTVVQNSIEHALDAFDRKVDEKIESAIDEIDLNQNVADWMDNNFDLENALSGLSVRINFD
jgi:cell fate (sporulation/competence/biofilm development) regulator YlbF (YheA/YmcA/DUF963 family)